MSSLTSKGPAVLAAGAFLLAILVLPAAARIPSADENVRLEDLAGDYFFEFEGQTRTFRFSVDQDRLFAAPLGETPEEIKPVKDQPLTFDVVTAEDGTYYLIKFDRNEKGIVDTCTLTVAGMEIVGKKITK